MIILFKHKYKILACLLLALVVATIKTQGITPVYMTHASLMVQSGRESLSRPEVGDDKGRVILDLGALLKTETQILTSADLIEKVITDLGVENIYPDMVQASPEGPTPVKEATIKSATSRFKGSLSAYVVGGSNVIKVSFRHGDPKIVARAVNQLIESFKLKHIEIFKNPRASFMEKRLAVYRQRLQESEKNLGDFKQKNRIFSLDQQRHLLIGQQSKLDTSLKDAQREIHEIQQRISFVTSQMQTIPKYELGGTSTSKSKNVGEAQSKLLNLKLRENKLLAKYNDESNRVIANVRKEIQMIDDFLATNGLKVTSEGESLTKNGIYSSLEMSLLNARTTLGTGEARKAGLEQQLNQVNGELQDLDAHERELRNLEREVGTNESNFKNYVTKLEVARTEEELDLMRKVNISVIQKAIVPLNPLKTKKKFNLLVGIILGIGSGLALAIFSEYCIGRGICTPEGVEQHLGLPILASVPYKELNNSRVVFKMVTIASLFLLLLLINGCSTAVKSPTPFNPRVVQEPSDSIGEYIINGNETLEIKFFYNPELTETVTVRPDGRISLQFAHDVMAVGLTPAELTDILTEEHSTEFVDPKLAVIVRSYGGQMAYVDGEVRGPKQLNLHSTGNNDITVSQAIALAGGLSDKARRHEVRVIRLKADKKPFVIPVNLNQVYNGTDISQDVVLQPYDIVYVPKSTIANVNLWMRQYIYNNFPSGGAYYRHWWPE
ncbi:polysaccharide biosynthesis/export family protein [Thermodesulfobacteriota bacterium]